MLSINTLIHESLFKYVYVNTYIEIISKNGKYLKQTMYNKRWQTLTPIIFNVFFSFFLCFRAARFVIRPSPMCIGCNVIWLVTTNQHYCGNSNVRIVIKHSNSSITLRSISEFTVARSRSVATIVVNDFRTQVPTPAIWHRKNALAWGWNWTIVQSKSINHWIVHIAHRNVVFCRRRCQSVRTITIHRIARTIMHLCQC